MVANYTEEEKDIVALVCKKLTGLSEKARREGILALEEGLEDLSGEIGGNKGKFMQRLFYFVIDGTDGSVIAQIAKNYTASSCATDFETFVFTLIADGVLAIQSGENPYIMAERFVSYLGFQNEEWFREKTGFSEHEW